MKKINAFRFLAFCAVFFLVISAVTGQNQTKKVLAEKSFTVSQNADLLVNHEHGNVICNNWDKNEITIKLTAYAEATDAEKADKIFDKISWEIKGNSDEVIAQCKISGKGSNSAPNMRIDMEINMPKSINLNLSHKFGKAFIDEVNGVALITSDYGSINVNNLTNPESKFKITYGDGHINNFTGNSFVIQYSKFGFDQANDASLKSDYSDVEGAAIGNTLVKLEGGNLNLGEVGSIKGSSSFSSLNIKKLTKSINIETSYGSLNIDKVDADFSEINIENNFGSANLHLSADVSFVLEANATHGNILFPEDKVKIDFKEKSLQKISLKGKAGNSDNPSKIILESNYGNINITE